MAGPTFEERSIQVERSKIDGSRELASTFRRLAEDNYRKTLVIASKWELYASLLEQGYSVEEANRRAFKQRIDQ